MNTLNDIISFFNGQPVEGYIWMSDSIYPIVYNNSQLDRSLSQSINPFPIEIMLYCKNLNRSLTARYADGQYIVTCKTIDEAEHTDEIFWPSFNSSINSTGEIERFNKLIQMRQYWKAIEDANCENMPVLQPAELVFIGFKDLIKEDSI